MNSPPQAEYQVTRDGEVLGTFTAEQLSSGVKRGTLLVTDHYWCEGWPEPQPLSDLFPQKARSNSTKERTELRHVGIALVMILGVAALCFAVFAIVKADRATVKTGEATVSVSSAPTAPKHSDSESAAPKTEKEGGGVTFLDEEPAAAATLSSDATGSAAQSENTNVIPNSLKKLAADLYQKTINFGKENAEDKVPGERMKLLRERAEQGDSNAQCDLGSMYASGMNGFPKDGSKAVEWFAKAAEQGHVDAQCILAWRYSAGSGIAKDAVKAVEWFTKAAEQGSAYAQYELGAKYYFGEGIPRDFAKAVEFYSKSAEQGYDEARNCLGDAQYQLARCYATGEGKPKDSAKAIEWFTKAAEQGDAAAQSDLSLYYYNGFGVAKDLAKVFQLRKAAAKAGDPTAQYNLALCYFFGEGTPKDAVEAAKWFQVAAEQGYGPAQANLGSCYGQGRGVAIDMVLGHLWSNLAAAQGEETGRKNLAGFEAAMTASQIAEAQRMAREFKPRKAIAETDNASPTMIGDSRPAGHGTGFFISTDGYLITNYHVVEGAAQVRINTGSGIKAARIIRMDAANDLALLKVDGTFPALPIASSRAIALGNTVATVGFPNIQMMGFSPKLAKGDIASLAGIQDDPRYFQISVPVQPGNSGGALVDGMGNVVGVVSAKLSARAALAATGALPENVNYAVKSSFLLSFLESVPELAGKLPDPHSGERKFEAIVKDAQQASVLVLVY